MSSDEPPCVLVVDDDEDLRDAVADTLRDVGYRVETAENGKVALERIAWCKPCIVLLDLMMPVMNGWQVAEAMEADPELANIPVCIVSAQATNAPPNAARVLRKPIARDDLVRAISDVCGAPPQSIG